jgi:hypothetical protein
MHTRRVNASKLGRYISCVLQKRLKINERKVAIFQSATQTENSGEHQELRNYDDVDHRDKIQCKSSERLNERQYELVLNTCCIWRSYEPVAATRVFNGSGIAIRFITRQQIIKIKQISLFLSSFFLSHHISLSLITPALPNSVPHPCDRFPMKQVILQLID